MQTGFCLYDSHILHKFAGFRTSVRNPAVRFFPLSLLFSVFYPFKIAPQSNTSFQATMVQKLCSFISKPNTFSFPECDRASTAPESNDMRTANLILDPYLFAFAVC